MVTRGDRLVRGELCDTAIRLARALPDEPEVTGLLSLLLLTDARRPARTDARGDLVLLSEQARAELLSRLDRRGEAAEAYRLALQLEPPAPERAFIDRRLAEVTAGRE
jgi:RNA polymerase sigma-70 factor (ECF subfamily)